MTTQPESSPESTPVTPEHSVEVNPDEAVTPQTENEAAAHDVAPEQPGQPAEPLETVEDTEEEREALSEEDETLVRQAAELIITTQFGSTSMIQRKLHIGYGKATEIMRLLEENKIIQPDQEDHTRAADVVVSMDDMEEAMGRLTNLRWPATAKSAKSEPSPTEPTATAEPSPETTPSPDTTPVPESKPEPTTPPDKKEAEPETTVEADTEKPEPTPEPVVPTEEDAPDADTTEAKHSPEDDAESEDLSDDEVLLVRKAVRVVLMSRLATRATIGRNLRIGPDAAQQILDILEERGIITAANPYEPFNKNDPHGEGRRVIPSIHDVDAVIASLTDLKIPPIDKAGGSLADWYVRDHPTPPPPKPHSLHYWASGEAMKTPITSPTPPKESIDEDSDDTIDIPRVEPVETTESTPPTSDVPEAATPDSPATSPTRRSRLPESGTSGRRALYGAVVAGGMAVAAAARARKSSS